MPTFTAPTRSEPIDNALGRHGVSFPVGLVVYILEEDDVVVETETFEDPTTVALMKDGSGDFGKALFRRGITYTVTTEEETILDNAGYTVS